MRSETRPLVGLRQRKKAKTRTAIQHEALRLFRLQGYGATTVDQIVDAVDVSPSTFFRYFPSKEALVLADDYDPLIMEAVRAQPADLGTIQALRSALRSVFGRVSQEELADMSQRAQLALSVPELRAAVLDQFAQSIWQLSDLIAERAGRAIDDFAVRTLAGAILGVIIAAEFRWAEHPESNLFSLLDEALGNLESGLRVSWEAVLG